jgi:integrase
MGTIVARGARWRAVVRKRGIVRTKSFSKVAAARRWINETELGIDAQADKGRAVTLGWVLDKYRTDIVEARVYQTKTHFHLRALAQKLRNEFVGDCTAEWWVSFARGLTCAPQSRRRYLSLLSSALRTAEALWDVPVDWPAYRKGANQIRQLQLAHLGRPRDRRPTSAELESICSFPDTTLPLADIVRFAVASAMRAAEIGRLRWEDLDDKHRTIVVRDRKHPSKKVGNHWTVPLLEGSYEILKRQEAVDLRIFPVKSDSILAAFRRACLASGIVNLHFHDLRHEAISRLFERGYSIQEVSLVSGHTNWSSLRIYTQIRPESLHAGPLAHRTGERSTIG